MSSVVLVTGGGRGIGRAVAEEFAAEGCSVAVMARSGDQLQAVVEQFRGHESKILAIIGDICREEDCEAAIRKTEESFGRIDILVNNAGIFRTAPLTQTSTEMWQSVLDTNLTGVFAVTRAFVRSCENRQAGGTIVNISSVAGKKGFPGSAAYCASKFGLMGFSEAIREELRPQGIRVIAVCPGQTDTAAWDTCGLDLAAIGIDRNKMMKAKDIGTAVVNAVLRQGTAIPEELVLRPLVGD